MSFRLTHYKDGVPREIKMSIWDAFKGAPTPTLKKKLLSATSPVGSSVPANSKSMVPCKELASNLVQCSCCHKVHLHKSEEKQSTNDKSKQVDANRKQNSNDDGAKDSQEDRIYSTREEESYSEADDKKIIELKRQQKNWKEILEAIGKESQSQLKAHWKKINPDAQDEAKDKDEGKNESGKKEDNSKKKEIEKKKAEGQAKKKQKQEGSGNSKTGKNPTSKQVVEATEMKKWSDRYDRQKWLAAASRHFDLTGQRITPEAARKLAEDK